MRDAGQRLTSLVRTSVGQPRGSTALSLQVSRSEAIMAHPAAPRSWPANSAFFLVRAKPRIERSTDLDTTVFEEAAQAVPVVETVGERFGELAALRHLGETVLEPGLQGFDDGF